jgi:hypothetical protein
MFAAAASLPEERGVLVIRIDTSRLVLQETAARIVDTAQERCASLTDYG